MDLLTLAGLIVAFTSVFLANWLGGGEVILLLNLPSAIIVVIGSLGAALAQSNLREALSAIKMLSWALFPPAIDLSGNRRTINLLAHKARRFSIIALEADIKALNNIFAMRAMQMAVDGAEPDLLSDRLHDEAERIRDKRGHCISFLESIGGYAPTLGIMGSVLGLIQAMANLDSPEALGHGIAVAFVSTLYGQGFANLVIFPICRKLSRYADLELLNNQMFIDGIHGIATGKHPQRLDLELSGYE
ncbi:motility protein A [Marinomonas ostreistagni]|uniref:MotA/TolQ/ExbB proton channel family protein n=1 Tax=Marinomonas ostreistagni TaxID=359209 RepID=A0ABS0Z6J6_9GAMM|nr:MotA/TolQ/ExbB proton channel family protein [Marinomonas ostreistagni]MBJ7549262.1 MotA/TolQ/ExbB proton channel family protein [Marinomonas ostreistagni]